MTHRAIANTWRAFTARDRKRIETGLVEKDCPRCPRCDDILEARPGAPVLECRECRRFHARVEHIPEYLYHVRIERLATAILQA